MAQSWVHIFDALLTFLLNNHFICKGASTFRTIYENSYELKPKTDLTLVNTRKII